MTDAAATTQGAAETGRDYKETLFLPQTDFPMRAGLPKAEPQWLARWENMGLYNRLRAQSKAEERTPFTLHDGPPYANGHLHMGHALNKILKDFVVRTRQMMGFDAAYVPGWDCHGLPIEWKVEEQFRAKGRKKDDVPLEEFLQACRDYAANWVEVQSKEFQRFGGMGEWAGRYASMDPASEAAIVAEFHKFVETGQVYRGSKPVMWSPVEATALAEAEVEYHDHQSHTIWVRFPVASGDTAITGASVVIWTTTPWTIPGNRAVSYGPDIAYGLYEVQALEEGLEFDPWAVPGERLILADALADDVFRAAKIAKVDRVCPVSAQALAKAHLAHPLRGFEGANGYYDFKVPLLAGDHVTDDAGTGFVHTAPSHGQEDFDVWMAHGLGQEDIPDMVDAKGAYYPHVAVFAGQQVIRTEGKKSGQDGGANPAVIKALIAAGGLLARGRLTHSYPHSWRSKAPLIYRNTPQWFIRLGDSEDPQSLRAKALNAIDHDVAWRPASAQNRIRTMVESRPDWLISRQRIWGAPAAMFVHKTSGDILIDNTVNTRIVRAIEKGGVEAWWSTPKSTFLKGRLPEGHTARDYDKVEDILDVWFDSACTHAFVLDARGTLSWPADVYLEGSDQHRGWFQSSLLAACGTRGKAPYRAVVTHGFLLDEEGRKMSKSLGNTVDPAKVSDQYGAEILRLWVATSDTAHDLRVGPSIIQANVDAYRKLRNTIRYLLGALDGYSDADAAPVGEMPGLERWVLHRLTALDAQVRAAYDDYDFKAAFAALFNFCTNDLSAFYLDIRKDSLYCDRPSAPRRRAARTVMAACFDRLTAWLAPILVFTMEEAWLARHPSEDGSVHLRTFPETPAAWRDDDLAARFARIRNVRRVVNGALEIERREKRIGSSLAAAPKVWIEEAADRDAFTVEAKAAGEDLERFLAEIVITSQAVLGKGRAPDDAFRLEDVAGVAVAPTLAAGRKCARSWRIVPDVGSDPRYPDLSARDAEAVAEWDAAQHGQGHANA